MNAWPALKECLFQGTHVVMRDTDETSAFARATLAKEHCPETAITYMLLVPLHSENKPIGLLTLGNCGAPTPESWTQEAIETVLQIAKHTTIQIDRVRLHAIEERRRWLLQRLDDAAADLRGERDLATLRKEVVNQAVSLADWTCAGLYLNRRPLQVLELVDVAGDLSGKPAALIQHGEGLIGEVALTRQPKLITNYATSSDRDPCLDHSQLYHGWFPNWRWTFSAMILLMVSASNAAV